MRARCPPWRLLAAASLLAGCTVGPDFMRPGPPPVAHVAAGPLPLATTASTTIGGARQRLEEGRDIPGEWWALFRSPQIVALVAQAIRANPDAAAAQATLREARENTRAEVGSLFPTVTANGSLTRERESLAALGLPTGGSTTFSLYSASLGVSYTFDVFGGIRRQVEQLGAQAGYERDELEATYLSLTANLVNALLTEAMVQAQVDATRQIVALYEQELHLMQQRFQLGGVSQAEVLQQQSTLASELALLPPLRKQLLQERDQIAAYLGLLPSQYTQPTLDLAALTLPGDLPVSLPSQVVAQRPDIRAYAALLHAATANVGVATANMLPQFTLTGSYGREGTTFNQAFTPSGIVWSLVGGLAQPIFEGGTLLHRRRAAVAALRVAAAQYTSTVNVAFQNVADALIAVQQDAETLHADLTAEQTAQASLAVSRAQYQAGAATYLTVLQAEQTYQSARYTLVSAQAARFTDTVALFQALGGGWWHRNDVDPKVAACCTILP